MGPMVVNGQPFQWVSVFEGESSNGSAICRKHLAGSILFQDDEGDGVLALVAD